AWRHYQEVIHSLSRDDQRVALAEQHLRALELRLPQLTIVHAPSTPADVRVRLDGIELGPAGSGTSLPLDPGTHAIEALAQPHEARTYSLEVKEGDRIVLEVEPGGELPARAAPPVQAAPPLEQDPSSGAPVLAETRPPQAAPAPAHDWQTSLDTRKIAAYS